MMPDQQLFTFILVLARVSAFVAFFPLFAQRQLPRLIKAGLALSLTVFWYGALPAESHAAVEINLVTSILYIAKEIGIGLLLAVLLGFIFVPAKIAGAYVGQEVGLSLAAVSSPGSTDSSTLVTTIFETLAIIVFFGLNLHHFVVLVVHYSLIHLSGKISLLDLPTELIVETSNALFEHGNLIIGPIGICLFVLTIGLALLNKAAPTLNLFSVGMTLRSGLGIVLMIIFMPVVLSSVKAYFQVHQYELEKFLIYFK